MGLFGSHSHVIIKMRKVDPRAEGGARILIKESDRDVSSLEKNLTTVLITHTLSKLESNSHESFQEKWFVGSFTMALQANLTKF